jgi:TRAP-type C4-dicarboxylate transport system permease small subunit
MLMSLFEVSQFMQHISFQKITSARGSFEKNTARQKDLGWGQMKTLKKIQLFFNHLLSFGIGCSSIMIFITWVIVCMEIVCRQFFKNPLVWVVEWAGYMILYSLFLGAAAVLKSEGHIKIELLLNWLKPQNRAIMTAINSILGAVACIILVWFGTVSTLSHYHDDIRTFTAMELPQWPFLIIIPIGCFLLLVQFIQRYFDNIATIKTGE